MNELVNLEKISPLKLFTEGDQLDHLLTKIKEEALKEELSTDTELSRKKIASVAFKISRSKTFLDAAGKELVKDWKAKAKKVDNARKKSREFLDELRDEVRQPLTEWEKREKERIAREQAEKEYLQAWNEALAEHKLYLRQKAIEAKEAEFARIEAERLAEEERIRREKEIKEYEECLKREAAEKAKREVEEKAKREREEAARKLEAEKQARKKAEREKIAAEERAKAEKRLAIERAVRESERKALEEKERLEKITAAEIAKKEIKARNTKHRKYINNQVLNSLIDNEINEKIARKIVSLVSAGKINNMMINY